MNNAIRLLVVDDHPVYREGLIAALRTNGEGIEIVGEASDGAQALEMVASMKPDIVLMDIKMMGMDGVEATRLIKARFPEVKVVALSAYDDDDYVLGIVRAGASGYMLKDADQSVISTGIRAVHEGNVRIHPRLAMKVFQAFARLSTNDGHGSGKLNYDGLTPREIEILQLVAAGQTHRQVATHLWISERTVDNHIQSIYSKLNISDRTQATLYAIRKGLISTEGVRQS